MKTGEQLEKLRRPLPEEVKAVIELQLDADCSETLAQDDYGVYSTGLFRYKGKDVLVTMDGGRWHLSVTTDHPIGYYELKEMRYQFLPDGIRAAQIFPPRSEFVNIHENCYHLYEIGDDDGYTGRLSDRWPSLEELSERAVRPVTGEDLNFRLFETARTVCKSILKAMKADGLEKKDLPQLLNDICKFMVLAEAEVSQESALFVIRRFMDLAVDLNSVMMRIVMHNATNENGESGT